MAYAKTNWVDGTTPISAANLNNMENGIANATAPGGFPTLTTNPSYVWSGTVPATGTGTVTITHNLGHYPIVATDGTLGNINLTFQNLSSSQIKIANSTGNAWNGTVRLW